MKVEDEQQILEFLTFVHSRAEELAEQIDPKYKHPPEERKLVHLSSYSKSFWHYIKAGQDMRKRK